MFVAVNVAGRGSESDGFQRNKSAGPGNYSLQSWCARSSTQTVWRGVTTEVVAPDRIQARSFTVCRGGRMLPGRDPLTPGCSPYVANPRGEGTGAGRLFLPGTSKSTLKGHRSLTRFPSKRVKSQVKSKLFVDLRIVAGSYLSFPGGRSRFEFHVRKLAARIHN